MTLKLLVDPQDDAILGAQGVGGAGVDKRIDVLATAITGGIAAADLELGYSPLYGSAKDPVNMLGYIDRNHRDGLVETVQWHELDDRLASGANLLDVRTPGEHTAMPIPGGINIELHRLRDRLDELPEGEIVVHCQAGLRGYLAARVLAQHGRDVVNLDGGDLTWAPRPDGAATTPSGDDEDRGSPAGGAAPGTHRSTRPPRGDGTVRLLHRAGASCVPDRPGERSRKVTRRRSPVPGSVAGVVDRSTVPGGRRARTETPRPGPPARKPPDCSRKRLAERDAGCDLHHCKPTGRSASPLAAPETNASITQK